MHFAGPRLIERTEQKFRRIRVCLKENREQAENGQSRRHI